MDDPLVDESPVFEMPYVSFRDIRNNQIAYIN